MARRWRPGDLPTFPNLGAGGTGDATCHPGVQARPWLVNRRISPSPSWSGGTTTGWRMTVATPVCGGYHAGAWPLDRTVPRKVHGPGLSASGGQHGNGPAEYPCCEKSNAVPGGGAAGVPGRVNVLVIAGSFPFSSLCELGVDLEIFFWIARGVSFLAFRGLTTVRWSPLAGTPGGS